MRAFGPTLGVTRGIIWGIDPWRIERVLTVHDFGTEGGDGCSR